MMPGMDGIELCRKLRDKSRDYYHYILMITGRTDHLDVVHALESGADDYISKPFEESDLRARLIVACRILALQSELIQSREELRVQAMKDGLTGLWNRTAFLDLFKRELDRAERAHGRTGLLLLDLDNFKQVNDKYGHLAGDMVLREVARRLKGNFRSYDFVGRYGGEEFFAALPGCGKDEVCRRSEIVRRAICEEPIRLERGEADVTLSIGGVVATPGEGSIWDVLAIADAALYKAKAAGRNCGVYCEKPWNETLYSPVIHQDRCAGCEVGRNGECVLPHP
jgi:diguanylate cyclase (GGDEF)-like protein